MSNIIYRASIPVATHVSTFAKGSLLTAAEIDTNLYGINYTAETALALAQAAPTTADLLAYAIALG
jgi:hypothetical protein